MDSQILDVVLVEIEYRKWLIKHNRQLRGQQESLIGALAGMDNLSCFDARSLLAAWVHPSASLPSAYRILEELCTCGVLQCIREQKRFVYSINRSFTKFA